MRNGKNAAQAIDSMLSYSGHVVIISGGCLALVFLFMVICPVDMLKSIGLVCANSIVALVLVNTLNTAAVLMIFPKFFMG